jgi:hypothetical protein
MSRKFIAAILAVSTTLAAFSAAPARAASEQDIAKILGAAATIFIIGKAIESSRDRDSDKKKKSTKNTVVHHNKPVIQHYRPIPKVEPRNVRPHYPQRAAIPQRCVRRITGGNVRRVAMGPCLSRHYTGAHPLPRACQMKVATQRGERRAYALPCLRQRGYTIARN